MLSRKFFLLAIALTCAIFMESAIAITYCDFTGNTTNALSGRFLWTPISNATFNGFQFSGQMNPGLTDPDASHYSFALNNTDTNTTALDMTQQIVS
ncbi:6307_t:CDS:1, partial [Cetraspora pellucida]